MPAKELELTSDQKTAYGAIVNFLIDDHKYMCLQGHSGTGKTTLMGKLLGDWKEVMEAATLLAPDAGRLMPIVTATTNKAAMVLAESLGKVTISEPVTTIHSFLGLRVKKDFKTGRTRLVAVNDEIVRDAFIIIDEASYADTRLLDFIDVKTENCKVLFVGDRRQLPSTGGECPAFSQGYPQVELTDIVRQQGDSELKKCVGHLRVNVEADPKIPFTVDGTEVSIVSQEVFKEMLAQEFLRENWSESESKILAWTNKRVQDYNALVSTSRRGTQQVLNKGDMVVVNEYCKDLSNKGVSPNEFFIIEAIEKKTIKLGITGSQITLQSLSMVHKVFVPDARTKALKTLRNADNPNVLRLVECMADVRSIYACTVHKSQGSTYDRVFIDLSDIERCKDEALKARMLYVAVSRAKHQAVLVA